jgi:hypothetical protein
MKTLNQLSTQAELKHTFGMLSLAALLSCSLAVPSTAQTISRIATQRAFTVAPKVSSPIVLRSTPDAACDLHAEDVSDKAHTLRFYANADGYLKIHVRPKGEAEDGIDVQLDCTENGEIVRYPLHVRASATPTEDMPAPQSVMPMPKGSTILPALTEAEAPLLSDDELVDRGYPIRPDAKSAPDKYAQWLEHVSRPMTLVPSHRVSRSDIQHLTQDIVAGPGSAVSWSGYVANHGARSYSAASGNWNVPEIFYCEKNNNTQSSMWIGLDGYGLTDLEQDGTEQDCLDIEPFGYFTDYYTWTEVLPGESSQDAGLSPNPGDRMSVEVWISTGSGSPNANGPYAAFRIVDETQGQSTGAIYTPLAAYYKGSSAEWIVERPCDTFDFSTSTCSQFAELSNYNYAEMLEPGALQTTGSWPDYHSIANVQLWMYNEHTNGDDDNELSMAIPESSKDLSNIYYQWFNYH